MWHLVSLCQSYVYICQKEFWTLNYVTSCISLSIVCLYMSLQLSRLEDQNITHYLHSVYTDLCGYLSFTLHYCIWLQISRLEDAHITVNSQWIHTACICIYISNHCKTIASPCLWRSHTCMSLSLNRLAHSSGCQSAYIYIQSLWDSCISRSILLTILYCRFQDWKTGKLQALFILYILMCVALRELQIPCNRRNCASMYVCTHSPRCAPRHSR